MTIPSKLLLAISATLLLFLLTSTDISAQPHASTTWQFKLLLKPESITSQQQRQALYLALKQQLATDDISLKHPFKLTSQGNISYYDSSNCDLYQQGYIVRFRQHKQQPQLTLKQRLHSFSPSEKTAKARTIDVLATSPITRLYDQSKSIVTVAPPTTIKQLNQLMHTKIASQQQSLVPVSGLKLQQQVWQGPKSHMGQHKLKWSMTLWTQAQQPLMAELSFKVHLPNNNLAAHQAEQILQELLQHLPQVAPIQMSKTAWVYHYLPQCH